MSDAAAAADTDAGAPDGNALAGAVAMTAGERSAGWGDRSVAGAPPPDDGDTGGGSVATGALGADWTAVYAGTIGDAVTVRVSRCGAGRGTSRGGACTAA